MKYPIWLNEFVTDIFNILENAKMQPLFVGGCVRDFYYDLSTTTDIDIAVAIDIHSVCILLDQHHIRYETIGIDYGTIGLYKKYDGTQADYHIEITSLRHEGNYDGRYPQTVRFDNVAVQQDAARRDFTINALYWHPEKGLYDYYNGLDDLHTGKLRFIGDAKERIDEDYLRILRYFRFLGRFASKDKMIDQPILSLLQQCAPIYLPKLKSERIGHEMMKIFALQSNMSLNIADILDLMARYDILQSIGLDYSPQIQQALKYYQDNRFCDREAILSLFLINKTINQRKDFCRKWSIAYKKLIFFRSPYDAIINFAYKNNHIHITRLVQNKHRHISHKILNFITALGYINQQQHQFLAQQIDHAQPINLPMSQQDIIAYYQLKDDNITTILKITKDYYLDNEGNIDRDDLIKYLNEFIAKTVLN